MGKHKLIPMASVFTTAINIICNILGGALLVLPSAFRDMSVVPALIMTALMGFASVGSIIMMIIPAAKYNKFTYKELLTTAFSERAGRAFDIVLFFYTYGVLIEFAKIVAQAVPPAVIDIGGPGASDKFYAQQWFWLLLAFPLFWAFSSMKQLTNLRWTSYLGIVTIYYVVFFLIVEFFRGVEVEGGGTKGSLITDDVNWGQFDFGFLKGFPILSVSYSCHYNIPTYYGEMKNRSPRRFGRAISIAMPIIMTTYILAGLFGYLMFGTRRVDAAKGNIMTAFSARNQAATAGQLGLFLHFTSVFPIVALGCRRCLNQLIFGSPWQSQKVYIIQAFLLVTTSSVLAYLVSGVGIVVEIIGALFGLSIVYIIPASFYIRLGGNRGPSYEEVVEADRIREEARGEAQGLLGASSNASKSNNGTLDSGESVPSMKTMNNAYEEEEAATTTGLDVSPSTEVDEDDLPKPIEVSSTFDNFLRRAAWCFVVGGILASASSFIVTIYRLVHPNA